MLIKRWFFVSIKPRIEKNGGLLCRCGSCFADSHDVDMAAGFCRLGVAVDFVWIGDFVLCEACALEG